MHFSSYPLHLLFFAHRVKTCLKMIAAQLNDQAHSLVPTFTSNNDEGEPNLKRIAKRERRLHMLSCNDIISPPLWCLPLVHSPQYLAQLWALAQEAKDVRTVAYMHIYT